MGRTFYGAVIIVILALSACEGGGGNCPWERPSCCDNHLFGCGPFDLPQGCSCADYFSRSFQGFPISAKVAPVRQTIATTQGTWRALLSKGGSGCSYLKRQTTATVLIRERNQQVTMKFLGLATLRGARVGRTVRARGRMPVPGSRCSATIFGDLSLSTSAAGTYTGALKKL
jgi:hypothetical protein